jgi:leader peptidase (prepilin peptidase) / N-methyltransferase
MTFAFIAAAFFAGLLIGSFLNVCIFRLPRDLTAWNPPRSFCPECEAQIDARDNIPLVSYLLLGGKCRHCKAPIPWRYPAVELATGLAFAWAAWYLGWTPGALKACVFAAIMIDLIATDFEERILPDEFTLGGIVLGLIFAAFVMVPIGPIGIFFHDALSSRWNSVAEAAVAAGFPSLTIWSIGWLYMKVRHRDGLGLGDVKMIATIGAFLGLRDALFTLILGSLLGAVSGIIYTWWAKEEMSTYELPFGSFLGIAALCIAAMEIVSSAKGLG